MHLLCSYCKTLLRCDISEVRDRFGSMSRFFFGGGITEINYRCNYMQFFYYYLFKCDVKLVYTISALYQIINFGCKYIIVKAS